MTLDEIIAALKNESTPAALTAGVAHAAELAPVVYAIADKICDGVYLLPHDNKLLFNGLHVLAAARHPDLCDRLLKIAEQDIPPLNKLFPYFITVSLARLLLSVWDREAGELFELIERTDIPSEVNWAFCEMLARLTFDGRIPREDTAAFLARIERDNLIDDDDMNWWGWERAVVRLGLVELEPALRRVWGKPLYEQHSEADHTDTLDKLRLAAADLADARPFDEENIRAIDDPVEGVAWVEQRDAMVAALVAERGEDADADKDTDAAKTIRLTDDEEEWLEGFLSSPQLPDGAMTLEALDGFFTALVIGPRLVPPSQYLPFVLGTDEDDGPDWDSLEQAEYVMALLAKHWNAIAARREANAEHRPLIDHFGMAMPGEDWAVGFMSGVGMVGDDAWDPLFDDERADQIVLPIMALCGAVPEEIQEQITEDMRATILEQLPAMLQLIAAYWRAPNASFPHREPVRSTKVGRNEPCPCGSGKKFKKCCGLKTPPTVH